MAIMDQQKTNKYCIFHGDCVEVMKDLPDQSVHLSVYSPPFGGLYRYSSDERDMSNCKDYEQFFEHYEFMLKELYRITLPGRLTAVHCAPVPSGNTGSDYLIDLPGDIIRAHERQGFRMIARHEVWKEPLWVRNRTMQKNLAHATAVQDSTKCGVASSDSVIIFRRAGENKIPVSNPVGFTEYAGDDSKMPNEVRALRGFDGDQKQNKFSHWIWRRYASSIWDDMRMDRVLPFKQEPDETGENYEKHVHPLQLDVIDRIIQMRSNPGENVFSPFMGIGSETYCAVRLDRRAIGVELKESYYQQAIQNMEAVASGDIEESTSEDMFGFLSEEPEEA